jgi:hypothetical protein
MTDVDDDLWRWDERYLRESRWAHDGDTAFDAKVLARIHLSNPVDGAHVDITRTEGQRVLEEGMKQPWTWADVPLEEAAPIKWTEDDVRIDKAFLAAEARLRDLFGRRPESDG